VGVLPDYHPFLIPDRYGGVKSSALENCGFLKIPSNVGFYIFDPFPEEKVFIVIPQYQEGISPSAKRERGRDEDLSGHLRIN